MKPKWSILALLGCVLFLQCAALSAQSRSETSYDGPRLAVFLARPIATTDLPRFEEFLTLSKDQVAYLETAFNNYESQITPIVQVAVEQAERWAIEGGKAQASTDTEARRLAGVELGRVEIELYDELVELDEKFLIDFASILAEPQLAELSRVKDCRVRDRARLNRGIYVPAASIDLAEALYDLGISWKENQCLDATLRMYEREMTPAVVAQYQLFRDDRRDAANLVARQMTARQDDVSLAEELAAQRQRWSKVQTAIAKINLAHLRRIGLCLLEMDRRRFEESVLPHMYPGVYPDQLSLQSFLEEVIERDEIQADEELRKAIKHIAGEYASAYRGLCEQMCRELDEYRAKALESGFSDATIWETIRRLRDERWKLSKQTMLQLSALLPPESKSMFTSHIDSFHAAFEMVWSNSRKDRFPS